MQDSQYVSGPVDGVFRSELLVILMRERGSWQKFHEKTKKGQWMKYLMESGSPCLDYRAFEV